MTLRGVRSVLTLIFLLSITQTLRNCLAEDVKQSSTEFRDNDLGRSDVIVDDENNDKARFQDSNANSDDVRSSGGSIHDNTADNVDATGERVFLKEIFSKYGHEGVMTFEGFEHLLVNLGLGNVWINDHDVHDHHTEEGFNEFHDDHTHNETKHDSKLQEGAMEIAIGVQGKPEGERASGAELEETAGVLYAVAASEPDHKLISNDEQDKQKNRRKRRNTNEIVKSSKNDGLERTALNIENLHNRKTRHVPSTESRKCLSPQEILNAAHVKLNLGISPSEFSRLLCPAIVYQLDAHVCHRHEPCEQAVNHHSRAAHCSIYHNCGGAGAHGSHDGNRTLETGSTLGRLLSLPAKVWGMALVAVTVISLCGLCSVAIIPIMDRLFYNQLLQFLIALAVGTLTGDALLHLLPHAMQPHSESDTHDDGGPAHDDDETRLIWIGLTVLGGVFGFFLMERVISVYGNWKKKRSARRKLAYKLRELGEPAQLHSRRSSRDSAFKGKHERHHHHDEEQRLETTPSLLDVATELTMMQVDFPPRTPTLSHDDLEDDGHSEVQGHTKQGHSHKGHGHSHGGGKVPSSVGSAAWMVIMGDGLHNFTDGLAIGASFASSISVGLSTSVAVFCHELPHELGDFAVLLKAGMSVKQALVYNIVSSVLCLAGMVIGLLLGNMDSATAWIFTVTAGIFIYIALVDMLPEMTGSLNEDDTKGSMITLLLHSVGIASGITIMMIIALYEDNIQLLAG